jgi:histidine triad (HIT) family protein
MGFFVPYLYEKQIIMTIFSKIINGDIPAFKIAESEKFIAFLDIEPLVPGHVLVVPKVEVNKIFDVPDDYLAEMLVFAKPIAHAIEKVFDCKRCGISVIGLEVPHAHMHLVPINSANDLNFTRAKLNPLPDELKVVKERLMQTLRLID